MTIEVATDEELGIRPFDPAVDVVPEPTDVVDGYETDEDAVGENRRVADDLDDEQDVTELHPNGMVEVVEQLGAAADPDAPAAAAVPNENEWIVDC